MQTLKRAVITMMETTLPLHAGPYDSMIEIMIKA
jgi:hypothetical protein